MLQFEELRFKAKDIEPQVLDLYKSLGIEEMKKEAEILEEKMSDQSFWDNSEESRSCIKKSKNLKQKIAEYESLHTFFTDTLDLIDIGGEMEDTSVLPEIEENIAALEKRLEAIKLASFLTGEYDDKNAIITFHAGAGGTEAQDWVEMLYRMYTRWAEKSGYKYKILDYLPGDEAGIKTASILIEGINAYGYLRSESGVHRLVRVSPFDSSGRRHTSFASLEVMPEIDDDSELEINDADLRVDTYRASGAGGQHVNKTESAVRITHIPTGVVVACQNERSQHQNREVAMKMLKSKLAEIKERENLEKIEDIKGVQREIAWGSQIRSYVFMPYTMVKDHRTSFEVGNIASVMDGDIDGFIDAYLKMRK